MKTSVKYFHLVVGPAAKNDLLYLNVAPKKQNPLPKIFFIAGWKTCRVFWGFEQLSSAMGWGAMRLVSQPKYPWLFPDFQVQYIHRPAVNYFAVLGHKIWTRNSSNSSKVSEHLDFDLVSNKNSIEILIAVWAQG